MKNNIKENIQKAKIGEKFKTSKGDILVYIGRDSGHLIYFIKEDAVMYNPIYFTEDGISPSGGELFLESRCPSEVSALENKISEVMHYICLMVDFVKDHNFGACMEILRWTRCLTDVEYRRQFGDKVKKNLWEYYKIKA